MMRFIASLIALALLASCASPGPRRDRPFTKLDANPSAVVAAELSFARLAQKKGQWTAFRETVADDAVMFTPGLVNAKQWLKGKADPAASVEWQPHKIYMSCDGSMGASIGAWQAPDGSTGHFVTIWQRPKFNVRRPDKKVEWKWVFDDGVPSDKPLDEPDFIETEVAACKTNASVKTSPGQLAKGASRDGTLLWSVEGGEGGSRNVSIDLLDDSGKYARVHQYSVIAPTK